MPFTIAERIVTGAIVAALVAAVLGGAGVREPWWGWLALGVLVALLVAAYAALYNLVVDR